MIHIRAFRVSDDEHSCLRYISGHRKVLESYGVTKVTSGSTNWMGDPNTYVIIVEDENRERIFGGARVQLHSKKLPMPLEDAIAILDNRIYPFIEELGELNVAEFCGLWNSREVAGYGIGSIYMGRIGVAITSQLNIKYLMALCSPATLRNCLKVGFEVTKELGNNGTFYYPKEDLTATGLIIRDLQNLPFANQIENVEIQKIRNNLSGVSLEQGPKGEMEFCYDLNLPTLD
jgi:hypothetical protein